MHPAGTPVRRPHGTAVVVTAALLWTLGLGLLAGTTSAQTLSNLGLVAIALAAGLASLHRARTGADSEHRFWRLLGAGVLCWSAGQMVWSGYEALGREVPFPSPADIGYLGLPPLAAAALLALPLAAPTLAGRVRTLLDGLMVAGSMLLCSWVAVLGPVVRADGEGPATQAISLAYPIGDVVVITIVFYTWLRARQASHRPPVSLAMVGGGLVAFAVSDSGFVYLTTVHDYSSGSIIDLGWFLGFALVLLAARRVATPSADAAEREMLTQPIGNLLPYAAVTVALLTSAVEVWRTGHADVFVSWIRTAIMVLLVIRQVLTLAENQSLTRNLEDRVQERTRELQTSRQRFEALVQHSSDVVTVVDRSGVVVYQSGSIERVLGYRAQDLQGRSLFEVMRAPEAAALRRALAHCAAEELRIQTLQMAWRHGSGARCEVEVTITNLLDNPDVGGLVLNTRDVTDRALLERQLTEQAFTDSLTGLPNRALFKDRLQHALSRRSTAEATVGVMFMDLDGFKAVNDTLGHSAGDELLVQVAARLRAVVRPGDTVARFGGDEFAVLLEDLPSGQSDTELALRINESLREPFALGAEQVHVAASVGIARADEHAESAEQLLRNADLAMYQAKAAGAGGHAAFRPEMHAGLVERVRLESDLRRAVENQELVLHYQPMISMRSGEITGVEALVRWQHPQRGLLAPGEFIPVAESTGLIRPIGAWVLGEACRQTVRWHHESPSSVPLRVSVNVSPRQLHHGDLPDLVRDVLAETGLSPELLTLEMTESVLIENREEGLADLTTLHDTGVRLAIDDFGTGYSSLSYLHRFPVDVLKIDRSFVERLSNGGDTALVSTILRLGRSLHIETVAEGIERPQEMLMLRRQGCTTGQGFHFSPPVPAADLRAMLSERAAPAVRSDEHSTA
jgi:diguanylate cyclase (GGDEF)-like protein/PAS domain S-box-containing protein